MIKDLYSKLSNPIMEVIDKLENTSWLINLGLETTPFWEWAFANPVFSTICILLIPAIIVGTLFYLAWKYNR